MTRYLVALFFSVFLFVGNAQAQSQYCVWGTSVNLPYPSNCFSTKWEAETQLRTEPATEIGAQLLEPVTASYIPLSETTIKYEVKPKEASFLGDVYTASAPSGFDRDCDFHPFALAGISGCESEADLENNILGTYPYYGTATGEYVGAYSPSPPVVWAAMPLDAATNRWHVRVIKNASNSRSYHVFNNVGGFTNYSLFGTDFYQCPRLFYGKANTSTPFSPWPLVCGNSTERNISVTSGQFHSCAKDGNPCVASTGNKEYRESDFDWEGESFKRAYNSIRDLPLASGLGDSWAHTFSERLSINSNISWIRNDGYFEGFTAITATTYKSINETGYMLTKEPDPVAAIKGTWRLESNSSKITWFDSVGKLSRIEYSSGKTLTFNYCSDTEFSAGTCNYRGGLTRVTSGTGRTLDFYYVNIDIVVNAASETRKESRISSIKGNGTTIVSYVYSDIGQLTSVLYGDSGLIQGRQYLYAETAYLCKDRNGNAIASCNTAYFPYHLTGVMDEKNVRYATYTYDQLGRVTSSKHANDAGITKLNYSSGTSVEVTLATGAKKVYTIDSSVFKKPTNLAFFDSNGLPTSSSSSVYIDMRLSNRTEANGFKTTYDYNNFQQISRTEALTSTGATTPQTRTQQTDWHASFNVPLERRTLNATNVLEAKTKYTYNTRGQTTAMCQIDPGNTTAMSYVCGSSTNAPAGVRQSTMSYCEAAGVTAGTCPIVGLMLSSDGPRTDVNDITSYSYYQTDASTCATAPSTCAYRKGDLWKVTNALNHVMETTAYDGAGRALQIKDANGVITDMLYHPRGWLTHRKVRGVDNASEADDAITKMDYDATGQVIKVTQPDGDFINFTYDAAHRLTGISDALGNSMSYTLDNAGNRTGETTKDPSNVIKRSLSRVYDTLGRLQASKNAANTTLATLTYDANDNLNTSTDGLSRITDQDVDPLNRLIKTISDQGVGKINATTQFEYDARDNLTKVIDPKALNTVYTYNGLNDLTALSSPDTGNTSYTYDSAGNRKTQIDAKTIVTNYNYDVLNRLTQLSYPSATTLSSNFIYDTVNPICAATETFAKGRLTKFTDPSGNTQYCYDRLGNLTRKQVTNNAIVSTVLFGYTKAGRLSSITYPSGMVVNYTRNAIGQITQVNTTQGATTTTIVNNVQYLPMGPIKQLSFPVPAGGTATSTLTQTRNYDNDYAIQSIGGLNYSVDVLGNITSIVDTAGGNTFAYDNLDRLTKVKNSTTLADVTAFTYDATGNRLTKKIGTAAAVSNTYPSTSHRLTNVGTVARTLDANGNTTKTATTKLFTYDARNRMVDFRTGTAASTIVSQYQYNAKDERVRKYKATTDQSRYLYDQMGQILAQVKIASGVTTTQEIIWLDDMPVAINQGGTLHGILTDHLNTPRAVFQLNNQVKVWRWDAVDDAFGEKLALEDPDANAVAFKLDMRFSGQLYDSESGMAYNYFRDCYEASAGRYCQSDPIGLAGGVSTYGYVGGSPVNAIDPLGLLPTVLFGRAPPILMRAPAPRITPLRVLPRGPGPLNPLTRAIRQGLYKPERLVCPNKTKTPIERAMDDLGFRPRGPTSPEVRQPLPLPPPPAAREGVAGRIADILEALFGSSGGSSSILPAVLMNEDTWEGNSCSNDPWCA